MQMVHNVSDININAAEQPDIYLIRDHLQFIQQRTLTNNEEWLML